MQWWWLWFIAGFAVACGLQFGISLLLVKYVLKHPQLLVKFAMSKTKKHKSVGV